MKKASILGPSKSIAYSQRREDNGQDIFIKPVGVWPTDHKAVLVEFWFRY